MLVRESSSSSVSPFRVVQNALVQVAAVNVQSRRLGLQCGDDSRMAVADAGNIVVEIQIATTIGIEQR